MTKEHNKEKTKELIQLFRKFLGWLKEYGWVITGLYLFFGIIFQYGMLFMRGDIIYFSWSNILNDSAIYLPCIFIFLFTIFIYTLAYDIMIKVFIDKKLSKITILKYFSPAIIFLVIYIFYKNIFLISIFFIYLISFYLAYYAITKKLEKKDVNGPHLIFIITTMFFTFSQYNSIIYENTYVINQKETKIDYMNDKWIFLQNGKVIPLTSDTKIENKKTP